VWCDHHGTSSPHLICPFAAFDVVSWVFFFFFFDTFTWLLTHYSPLFSSLCDFCSFISSFSVLSIMAGITQSSTSVPYLLLLLLLFVWWYWSLNSGPYAYTTTWAMHSVPFPSHIHIFPRISYQSPWLQLLPGVFQIIFLSHTSSQKPLSICYLFISYCPSWSG
jgi:hypothetical protein